MEGSPPTSVPVLQVSRDCARWEAQLRWDHDGETLIHAVAVLFGVSEEAAAIHVFQYLTNYATEDEPTSLTKRRLAFVSGALMGALLSGLRSIRPTKDAVILGAHVLIFADRSPVEQKLAQKLAAEEASPVVQAPIAGVRDLLMCGLEGPVVARWGWGGRDLIWRAGHFGRCIVAGWKAASFPVPAYTWRRFGLSITPAFGTYVSALENYFRKSSCRRVLFTTYVSSCSFIADAAKIKAETITRMHGVPLLPFSARTTSDVLETDYQGDIPGLRKYGFSTKYRADKDYRRLLDPILAVGLNDARVPTFHRIGYSTNLFLGTGPFAGTDDRTMARHRVPEGERAGQLMVDYLKQTGINEVLLKVHPREDRTAYDGIVQSWLDEGVTTKDVDRDELFAAEDCLHVAHLSTLALELLAAGRRVAIFRLSFAQDEENTLGALAKALSFGSPKELAQISAESEAKYWQRVMKAIANLEEDAI